MTYPISTLTTGTFTLLDTDNLAITGASFASKTATLSTDEATAEVLTVTELSGGKYRFSFTPTAVGDWDCLVIYNTGGLYRRFEGTYQVVTADQFDPMASSRAAELDLIDLISAMLSALLATPTLPPIGIGPSRQVTLNGVVGFVSVVAGHAVFTPSV